MYSGKKVFAQIMSYLPKRRFDSLVNKYRGNHGIRKFSCWDQCLRSGRFNNRSLSVFIPLG
ncbi:MAG: DUF4372 domain-containing protein [Proteobacteria bacterium]|nr:DUF4372 domain-containing protein [Pseudomonadota bacterium]